ncbi:glycosyltransferase family 2 protein [Pluralibacter gergoviae]|uniref:Glycosyltransferase family 2 protein n=1 Tax=Pluralibacter gergoviae TaxID=61647 RepID=A0AAI9DRA2_PLUGE|nr:glycosyltransferase family 2 protein [Pluralibacter gergoviae]EKV0918610.1 glycosyltransferase family 2 protein [Pluralibacter gergoviae]EKV3546296.1 glycosyltransferase family 2 protein [Pluralibacter gergoviae]EKV9911018.1 glycosyltransferase family 2 protein [Pluralibacter gergoviae]EKV9933769.1 glycosyltransferase family 2 protein [Pluralibacter gergoviae]EKW9974967.1 glycosyltransferase family 2 protein [Pluralibacter gergoviae]
MNRSVAILMAIRNGQEYIPQQLNSFIEQSYTNWSLFVSDDGSSDTSAEIVKQFFLSYPEIDGYIKKGPCKGFCENFQSMINDCNIISDYYAFSDQDDIWLPDKLTRATKYLNSIPSNIPALYCSVTTLIDENNRVIGQSLIPTKNLDFANALLHNIASGNTMVFNQCARELLMSASSQDMVVHDWTLYQIVTACGGEVYYDNEPTVLYRQHANNVIGDGRNILFRAKNFLDSFSTNKKEWNDRNEKVLKNVTEKFTDKALQTYMDFYKIKKSGFFARLFYFKRSGVYHQYTLGTLSTLIYVCFGKM